MTPGQALFTALCVTWLGSELWIGRLRSGDPSRRRDRGTLGLVMGTACACVAAAVWLAARHGAPFRAELAPPVAAIGLALMVAGMALRWWAVRVLAAWFTVDVAIRPGHRLVRRGPYRLLRHPSYTGALATFLGFGLALGDGWALLVLCLPVTAAFAWRIRVEERVLATAFPDEYPAYARATRRLLPFVW